MENEKEKQDNSRWSCGFSTVHACDVYVCDAFPSPSLARPSAFVCSSEGRAKAAHSLGAGETFGSVSKPALFFLPPLSTSVKPSNPRRNAERPPGMGLSNAWQRSSILFRGGVPVSRIFIVDRAVRVSFLSRVPHFYDDDDDDDDDDGTLQHTIHFLSFPSFSSAKETRKEEDRYVIIHHERISMQSDNPTWR